jgi:hypothetical protein
LEGEVATLLGRADGLGTLQTRASSCCVPEPPWSGPQQKETVMKGSHQGQLEDPSISALSPSQSRGRAAAGSLGLAVIP